MEWLATHALQIVIFLEILTSLFDLYVKWRQLKKFNETEIPEYYKNLKSRNGGEDVLTKEEFLDS